MEDKKDRPLLPTEYGNPLDDPSVDPDIDQTVGSMEVIRRRTEEDPASVQVLQDVLGLITAPETGPEPEEEVKARREISEAVRRMLVLGLVLSTTALFTGLGLSAYGGHHLPRAVSRIDEVVGGLTTGFPPSILSLGILLLIATPALSVLGSLIAFLRHRDWRYASVSFLVLTILAISAFVGTG